MANNSGVAFSLLFSIYMTELFQESLSRARAIECCSIPRDCLEAVATVTGTPSKQKKNKGPVGTWQKPYTRLHCKISVSKHQKGW